MRLLNCMFTYNRPHYLRNATESLLEFFRLGDMLVVDDGSSDPEQVRYLAELEGRGVSILRRPRGDDMAVRAHGGLYRRMNDAVDYANARGYDYVQFVQDDMQFVWHDPELLAKAEKIFARFPDASQVWLTFLKATDWDVRDRLDYLHDAHCYRHRRQALIDTGIFRLEALRREQMRFENWEQSNSNAFLAKGYHAYLLPTPVLAWIPWPMTFTRDQKFGKVRSRPERYYLKPLSAAQIQQLTSRPLEELAFHEDYCFPWGWGCWTPYWFNAYRWHHWWKYTCLAVRASRTGRLRIPHWRRWR